VLAIVQLGVGFRNYLALTAAVREGARVAVVSRNEADPVATTKAAVVAAGGDIGLTTANVNVTPGTAPWAASSDVKVSATVPFSLKLFGISVAGANLNSSTTVRVE
jgi:hypothetical protein